MKKIAWRFVCSTFLVVVFLSIKTWEVTVYIFITLFLLGIVRKRDAPSFIFASGDTLQLKVSFRSDSIGVFVREFHIYGNFPFLPFGLTVEGDCI
ncbi:hypothetical protein NXW05_02875 [Phocaeicola vulgatus]|nr:hypothetical protein [Phocaeicola vulgatus]